MSLRSYLRSPDTGGIVGVKFAKAKSSRNYYTVWSGWDAVVNHRDPYGPSRDSTH